MRFERSLRPYLRFFTITEKTKDQDVMIQERAFLSTHGGSFREESFSENHLPELIKLRLEMRPTFVEKNVEGTCSYQNKIYDSCCLWKDEVRPLEKIALVYTGYGQFFKNHQYNDFTGVKCDHNLLDIGPQKPLYTKKFMCLLEEKLTLDITLSRQEGLQFAPSFERSYRPLWGYGGSFYPQIKVADIMQYYVSLDHDESKTVPKYYAQKSLQEKGLVLRQNEPFEAKGMGKIVLMTKELEGCERSLEEDIVRGFVQFSFQKSHSRYVSIKAQQLGLSKFVEVIFQRQGR